MASSTEFWARAAATHTGEAIILSAIVEFITAGYSQYKVYLYIAIVILILVLCGSVYIYRADAKTAAVKLAASEKERDFYHYQLDQTIASHNEYVTQLAKIQQRKDRIHVVYRDQIRRIEDAHYGPITQPLVIFSMREFAAYSSATR